MRLYGRLLGAAALVVLVDQVTKSLALSALEDGPIHVIPDLLSLRITYNSGGAFGLLQGVPGLFLVAGLVIGGLILLWVKNLEKGTWLLPFGIVLGGGLGNVVDRVFRAPGGAVVDFIDIHRGSFQWPLFNVADASIVIGVALILVFGTRKDQAPEVEGPASDQPDPDLNERPSDQSDPDLDERPSDQSDPDLDERPSDQPDPDLDERPSDQPDPDLDERPSDQPASTSITER